ncbi:MAG: FAD-dependent oxidoreductase, partial [Bdellovibrionota bacterium]
METRFDAIVIGGGHAGVEASRALSARGFKTALISFDSKKIGAMSCNPAIGGVAKSHLVYEVDALGGLMGTAADHAAIQSRRLNLRKGPAVRSTRVQCDKAHYTELMSGWAATCENLHVIEGEAASFTWDESSRKITGVRMKNGLSLSSRAVVITSGTFMRGLMFCGDDRAVGGRV